jgi:hypothetical protein
MSGELESTAQGWEEPEAVAFEQLAQRRSRWGQDYKEDLLTMDHIFNILSVEL